MCQQTNSFAMSPRSEARRGPSQTSYWRCQGLYHRAKQVDSDLCLGRWDMASCATVGDIPTMFPIILQASYFEVYAMDLTEDSVHGCINLSPLTGLHSWKRRVLEDLASAVVH